MNNKLLKQIPNMLTIIRIIFAVIAFYLVVNNFLVLGLVMLIFGSLTDFLDGYFARKFKAESKLGARLDQLADKIFEILFGIALIIKGNYLFIITIGLEVLFTILVIVLYAKSKFWQSSTKIGKIKTSCLFVTIIIATIHLLTKEYYVVFLIIWIINTIVQIIANLKSYLEYKKNNKMSQ